MQNQWAGALETVNQISLPIVVPERAGIFPAFHGLDGLRLRPRPRGIFGVPHEQTFERRADEDIIRAVVITQCRRPRPLGITGHLIVIWRHGQPREHLADDLPIDQVARMQHLHADEVKIRRDQIKIVPDANDVGVRIIRGQNRISIGAVALVAPAQWRFGGNGRWSRLAGGGKAHHHYAGKKRTGLFPTGTDGLGPVFPFLFNHSRTGLKTGVGNRGAL